MISKSTPILSIFLALLVPAVAVAAGSVDVRILDRPITDLDAYATALTTTPAQVTTGSLRALMDPADHELTGVDTKANGASDVLLVPYFEVDRTSADGATTLLAVRNETDAPVPVRILYVSALGGTVQTEQTVWLAPDATQTINLRDVQGLSVDPDGVSRGLVVLGAIGTHHTGSATLSGDFFFIDPATDYSTGSTLLDMSFDSPKNELCESWSTRFFRSEQISTTSSFRFVVDIPSGSASYDSPTAVGTVYDEAGNALRSFEIRTDLNSFQLTSADLVPEGTPFGSLSIRFVGTDGAVLAEHSGFHRLSVALRGACLDQ